MPLPVNQWFEDWQRGGVLIEDTRHLGQWDQTLTLLWFDDEQLAPPAPERKQWDEDTYRLRSLTSPPAALCSSPATLAKKALDMRDEGAQFEGVDLLWKVAA